MFSLRFTIILLFILFIPFCLRAILGIEPYPAVLLPSGAGSIKKTGDQIVFNYKKLFALDNKGEWTKIDPSRLLYPIPVQYLPNLTSNNFGFDVDSPRVKSKTFRFLKMFHLTSERPKSEEDIREAKKWLKEKLISQHLNPSRIKFASYTQIISTRTGAVVENNIKNEKIVSLDE